MATLESFESLLKEVVTAKRLSASKMNKLTDIAMNLMEDDTQLISTLYRTHKTLAPSSKIHSLYAFDALSRAARSKTNKFGLTGDINAEKGNFATFLLKVDGVLDGLIQDMVSLPTPEAKEKTRKILDIWTKNGTFPPNVLARLAEMAKDFPQTDTINEVPPADPRAPAHESPPPIHVAPALPAPQPPVTADPAHAQALLQALLGSALSSTGDNNLTNGSTLQQIGTNLTASGLEPNQVVLLQQLVERAKAQNNNGAALPVPFSPPVALPLPTTLHTQIQPIPSASYNSPPRGSLSVPRDENIGNPRKDQQFSRWEETNRETASRSDKDDWYERERHGWRGGFRGGRGGPPNRGNRTGWRDQDNWEGPSRRRRSRSRSPPRFGGSGSRSGRDIRPYSPPRRPSLVPPSRDEPERAARPTPPGALQKGKDEFGRDIRTPSPDPVPAPEASSDTDHQKILDIRRTEQSPPKAPRAATSSYASSAPQIKQHGGLDTIDFATFDFSSPAAWEALGKSWQVTHGSLPSQEQLMQLVMVGMSQNNIGNSMGRGESRGSTQGNGWKPFQNQPGKSIPTYESGSNLSSNSWQTKNATWQRGATGFDYEHGAAPDNAETDAVVLGGGETQGLGGPSDPADGSGSGGMKRVGDRWVWQPS